jgi:Isochorismatase family
VLVSALAKLARPFEMSAIVSTAGGGARVTPEIAAALGELRQHPRTTTDAFTHAPTREAIVGTGRTTLLIAGVATEVIVQHSALSAAAPGLACPGRRRRVRRGSPHAPKTRRSRRLAHAGVDTTSVASIAGQLAGDFSQPKGRAALAVLSELASA